MGGGTEDAEKGRGGCRVLRGCAEYEPVEDQNAEELHKIVQNSK